MSTDQDDPLFQENAAFTPLPPDRPLKLKFMPWHKPRKQWVRFNQWLKGTLKIIDDAGSEKIQELSYLSLPGDDMLDVRMLGEGCSSRGVSLKYLGFNSISAKSESSTELNISESELMKTGFIAEGSKVLQDPIESIASTDSKSYMEARRSGPFHIINFDLCSSVANQEKNYTGNTYLQALKNLVELQVNEMKQPWILFLTTNVSKESVAETVMVELLRVLQGNISSSEEFAARLKLALTITAGEVDASIDQVSRLSEQQFFDCFTLGFSKWLLALATKLNSFKVQVLQSCKYKTGDPRYARYPDMLSLGFRFDFVFQPIADDYGIALKNLPARESEKDQALPMIKAIEDIFDLDEQIQADHTLRDQLTAHSVSLMEKARFDRDKYLEWVSAGCPA